MSSRLILTVALLLCSFYALYADSPRKTNKEGINLYEQERFDEALERFRSAQLDKPEEPILHHNVGVSLYKMKKYDKAIEELAKSIPEIEDTLLSSKIYYNIGNCYFKMDSLLNSIFYYQQALKLNPNDEDAKYNLELALSLLKQNSQKKQTQSQQQQQQQQQQKQQQKQEESQEQKQQEEQKQKKEGEISKEEAERILDALEQQEKETQKDQVRQLPGRGVPGKDW